MAEVTDDIKQKLTAWIKQHYPCLPIPGEQSLARQQLLDYYDHMEVAMLQLDLHDEYPDYLRLLRKRRNFIRRMDDETFKKDIFRAQTLF